MKFTSLHHFTGRSLRRGRGFSLVELLVVMAVLAVITSLVGPAFVSIGQSQGVTRAVNTVSERLEHARAQAMARNTYIFVGFADTTDGSGISKLVVVETASNDGTDNVKPDNLTQLVQPIQVANVQLGTVASSGATVLSAGKYNFPLMVGGVTTTFNKVIAFNPQGEGILTDAVDSWIEVPLQPMRGSTKMSNNDIAVKVSGVSGQQLIVRK